MRPGLYSIRPRCLARTKSMSAAEDDLEKSPPFDSPLEAALAAVAAAVVAIAVFLVADQAFAVWEVRRALPKTRWLVTACVATAAARLATCGQLSVRPKAT